MNQDKHNVCVRERERERERRRRGKSFRLNWGPRLADWEAEERKSVCALMVGYRGGN